MAKYVQFNGFINIVESVLFSVNVKHMEKLSRRHYQGTLAEANLTSLQLEEPPPTPGDLLLLPHLLPRSEATVSQDWASQDRGPVHSVTSLMLPIMIVIVGSMTGQGHWGPQNHPPDHSELVLPTDRERHPDPLIENLFLQTGIKNYEVRKEYHEEYEYLRICHLSPLNYRNQSVSPDRSVTPEAWKAPKKNERRSMSSDGMSQRSSQSSTDWGYTSYNSFTANKSSSMSSSSYSNNNMARSVPCTNANPCFIMLG